MDEKTLKALITEKVHAVLEPALGTTKKPVPSKPTLLDETKMSSSKNTLKEALILIPKTFILKTEYLSGITKELHMKIYKAYVDSFNKISAKLDSLSNEDASTPNDSVFRHAKLDEQNSLNGTKLHELYFNNISDVHSEIHMDSIPYMRFARDWGTFDRWQFDFRACGMCAEEGWAICYYDPFKQKYLNTFIEKNSNNMPLCGIPVIVMDTWHHAWFRDHPEDKEGYLNSMFKELRFDVIEARMVVAERANLHYLYAIQPAPTSDPQTLLAAIPASNQPPIAPTMTTPTPTAQQQQNAGMDQQRLANSNKEPVIV
jgi:Fe-Mn family superoxide dismutase